jgi:hypothetical protein
VAFSSGLTEQQANSLNDPSSKKLEEKEKLSIQTASSSMKKINVPMKPLSFTSSSKTNLNKQQPKKDNNSSSSANLEAQEERTRFDRWKMMYPSYNSIRSWLESLYSSFSSYQSGIFRYSFKNLSDFRQKMSLLWFDFCSPLSSSEESNSSAEKNTTFFSLYHLLTDSFLFEKGFFYSHYKAIQEEFKFEFSSLFDNLKEYLEVFLSNFFIYLCVF